MMGMISYCLFSEQSFSKAVNISKWVSVPSPNRVSYVCDAFAVLSATENALINQWKLILRNAAKEALSYTMGSCKFSCENHKIYGQKFVLRMIVKVFFNNKSKISTESVRKDSVASFKKQKWET